MGITKSAHFTEQQNEMALLFKALGHPARMAIVDYLLKVNSCVCGDIVNELPLAQATISQHLKELKQAGVIKGSIEGASICYCLDESKIDHLISFFSNVQKKLNKQSKCC